MELFRFIRYNRKDVVSLKCFVQLNKKKPAFYDIHTLSARNLKLEAEERTRRRPFVNQQKWWKKRKEATREETFQKTARQLRILAGFGSQGGACESTNPCGIIITEKKRKKKAREGERNARIKVRDTWQTLVCADPPSSLERTEKRFDGFFFFFFYTRTSRIARTTSTIRIAWKTQPRIVENSETSSPASILPPFPSICINERESVGGFSRVCTPCRASIARGGRIKYNAETRTVESCDERERERESFRRPYLFSWDWGECAESSRVWGGVPSRISFSVVR